jgi:hypothetical protein
MSNTTTQTTTETLAIEILTPIAEFLGVLIHEGENGSYYYFDKDGYQHCRNTRLNPKQRLAWIKTDISWYALKGWL